MNSFDENDLPREQAEVAEKLQGELSSFRAKAKPALQANIFAALEREQMKNKPVSRRNSGRERWWLTLAASVIIGLGLGFYMNDRVIRESKYIDNSISIFQLMEDSSKMVANNTMVKRMNNMNTFLWDMSVGGLVDDIALLTFDANRSEFEGEDR